MTTVQTTQPHWQQAFSKAIKTVDELLQYVHLTPEQLPHRLLTSTHFPLRIPHSFVQRIEKNNPLDPLLLQILPQQQEQQTTAGYSVDPVGDLEAQTQPGLIHKYPNRALLITTGTCAIHCRYCFRRFYPYSASQSLNSHWPNVLNYLSQHHSISEVILSGGDPLSLNDDKLSQAVKQLETIKHLKYLRIHTRLPIVLPPRIDKALLHWIENTRFKVTMVVHVNHPNEINQEVRDAILLLKKLPIDVLNQSVLLHRVNDTEATLIHLSYTLFDAGILPYYIHLLDKVSGAAHFNVSTHRAISLLRNIREQLPGYLVPQLVKEKAGATYKIPLT